MAKASPTRMKVGKKVRRARRAQDLSQEELGFKSGLHRTYIGSIERGEQNVSVDNLHKLARALKVSPKELMPSK